MQKNRLILLIMLLVVFPTFSGCLDEKKVNETELIVMGVNGEVLNLTISEILNDYPSVFGNCIFENSYGNWMGNGEYRGIAISTLADAVGGISNSDLMCATSIDGYTQIYTYQNIYPTLEINASQGTLILAYEFNQTKFPDWEDGMRIGYLPPDGVFSNEDQQHSASLEYSQAAASTRWVKWVNQIEFLREEDKITFQEQTNHTLSISQLKQLPKVVGTGGFLKTTGAVIGPSEYTGIDIRDTLDLFMNTSDSFTLEVISTDGYNKTFTKDQVFGIVPVYNETGYEITTGSSENLTMSLIYERAGETLTEDDGGPFMIGYLSTCNIITDGHFWVKYVDKLIIKEEIIQTST